MALTARIAALAQAVGADIKALTSGLAGKVDKEPGKALSSNDYTSDDKAKLAAMPRIEIVSELPAQEDPDTLYLVFPDESS